MPERDHVVTTAAIDGCEAVHAEIRVRNEGTLAPLQIDGIPENAVHETRRRVTGALGEAGMSGNGQGMRATLSTAGSSRVPLWDLPIAVGVLAAAGCIRNPADVLIVGRLTYEGKVGTVTGAVPVAVLANDSGKTLMLPHANLGECALAAHEAAAPVHDIGDAADWLDGDRKRVNPGLPSPMNRRLDLNDIPGNETAKRALAIAAAGGHNILLVTPEGAGSTGLARRAPGVLPPMTRSQQIETGAIASVAGLLNMTSGGWDAGPPFRAPHWSASARAMNGSANGNRTNRSHPGEVSLAHNGVLLLDEIDRFDRHALAAIREASQRGTAAGYPSRFLTIGTLIIDRDAGGTPEPETVTAERIRRNGLGEWFDLAVRVDRETWRQPGPARSGISTAELRETVVQARQRSEDETKPSTTAQERLEQIRRSNGEREAALTRRIATTIRDLGTRGPNHEVGEEDVEKAQELRRFMHTR